MEKKEEEREIDKKVEKRYEILRKINKGSYGVVWKAVSKSTRKTLALKKSIGVLADAKDSQRVYREIKYLRELNDVKGVIKIEDALVGKAERDVYMIFEFVESDLHAVIRAGVLREKQQKFILFQILNTIATMHTRNLVHRDLKPSNIMVNQQCVTKLIDFDQTRRIDPKKRRKLTPNVGSRWYRAPEILFGSCLYYGKKVDIWSIGCILAEMIIGKPLFPGNSSLDQAKRIIEITGKPSAAEITSLHFKWFPPEQAFSLGVGSHASLDIEERKDDKKSLRTLFPSISESAADLLEKMLAFNPKNRISAEKALHHPYFIY